MSSSSKIEIKRVTELDNQAAGALLQFIMSFADTKHFLGRRISEWVTAAPAMEASVAAANITQEELGHARSLFAMIRDVAGAPIELNTDTDLSRKEFYHPSYLNNRWSSWFEVIATFFLLDSALTSVIEAAKDSRLVPFRQRVAKILQEEHFHAIYYKGWLKRLSDTGENGKQQLNKAIEHVWPVAAAWFGPPDERNANVLIEAGIIETSLDKCYSLWLADIRKTLNNNGLTAPDIQIDWGNWHAQRREVSE